MKRLVLIVAIFCASLANAAALQNLEIASKIDSANPSVTSTNFPPVKPRAISKADGIEASPYGDSYSLAPLIEDSEFAYYMTPSAQATSHNFDGLWKIIGENQTGTPGGQIWLLEGTQELQNGGIRVWVQVTAANAQDEAMPWVDEQYSGFLGWRLDIATSIGGSNRIDIDFPFDVTGSGVYLYNSAGQTLDTVDFKIDIDDSSNGDGLSGSAFVYLPDRSEIAGYDLATMIMYWNIKEYDPVEAADLAITLFDAPDGTYAPGNEIIIDNKVENISDVNSDSYRITFYTSTDATITSEDHQAGFINRTALGAGENHHFSTTLGAAFESLPDGDYYIGAILTTTNDSNSSNNTKYDPTPITVSASGASVPEAPAMISADPGDGQAELHFAANGDGGSAITGYTAKCAAFTQAGNSSPITITGLVNGQAYSCSVVAKNAIGDSASSNALSVIPSADPPQSSISGSFSGSWFKENQSGHGLNIEVLNDTTTVIYWYVYHTDGTPMFLVTVGTNEADSTTGITYYNTGMKFGEFNPADFEQTVWGVSTVTFLDCNHLTLEYSSDDPAYGSGTIPMVRLTAISGLPCSDN